VDEQAPFGVGVASFCGTDPAASVAHTLFQRRLDCEPHTTIKHCRCETRLTQFVTAPVN
jgi:hypothetical protein